MLKTALFDCAINEKCCSVNGGRGICPLFSSPPRGIWQLKSPHPREFAIQGKKNANAQGGLGAGGIDWCITNTTSLCCSDEMSIQKHWKIRLAYLCHNLSQYYSLNLSKTCLCLVSYIHSLSKTCCLPSACQQRWREHVHCTHDAFSESLIQSLTTISCCFRFTSGVYNSFQIGSDVFEFREGFWN